jgi:hypothetical protein
MIPGAVLKSIGTAFDAKRESKKGETSKTVGENKSQLVFACKKMNL